MWQYPLIAEQGVLCHKPLLFVERLAQRSGVQPDTANALAFQEIQGVTHQGLADSPAAVIGIHQDHGNPGDGTEDAGDHRTDRFAVQLGHKTAVGLHAKIATPVGLGLVPAVGCLQPHSQRHVCLGHYPDLNHR